MKIYINTSNENIEIGGETFIPGEWLHLDDKFEIDLVKHPFIKSPQTILAEKYAGIPVKERTAKIKELHLDQFAAGIKQAEVMYKTVSNPLATQILAMTEVADAN